MPSQELRRMRLPRIVSRAPSRPAMPMMPTMLVAISVESPRLSAMTQSSMRRLLRRATMAASVALGSGSRAPPVTVTPLSTQSAQSSKSRP
jgi:hypothetical protein